MTRIDAPRSRLPGASPVPDASSSLKAQLLRAITPGQGNSHWLSFEEADRLVKLVERSPPADQARFRELVRVGLTRGVLEGRELPLRARALTRLADFAGVDPQVYLDAAPALGEAAGAQQRFGAKLDQVPAPAPVVASRASPAEALGQAVGASLQAVAEALTRPLPSGPIRTVEDANAFAAATLARHLADVGLDPAAAQVGLVFDRALWPASAFNNQHALEDATTAAAGFLAQMSRDRGGPVKLDVHLVPRGRLERTEGTDRDNLYVPVNGGRDALELRQDWDGGRFLRADSWWNPTDHLQAKKLRTLWKLVGNPVGILRSGMRRVLDGAQADLLKSAGRLQDEAGAAGPSRLRTGIAETIRAFVAPHVAGPDGQNLRDKLLARVAEADEQVLVSFLGRFSAVASDPGFLEEVSQFSLQATSNRLRDSQLKIGLVNVDTYDTVSVTPTSALARHGAPAVNDVELDGVRVGLVNVQSVDMVTVVPDLARMIFGGTALERAANESGLLA